MGRRGEATGSLIGMITGIAAGVKGSHIRITVGGPVGAVVGTVPCDFIGSIL